MLLCLVMTISVALFFLPHKITHSQYTQTDDYLNRIPIIVYHPNDDVSVSH